MYTLLGLEHGTPFGTMGKGRGRCENGTSHGACRDIYSGRSLRSIEGIPKVRVSITVLEVGTVTHTYQYRVCVRHSACVRGVNFQVEQGPSMSQSLAGQPEVPCVMSTSTEGAA